jgi:RimJ/RimL family protein N-acetyltransferase
VLVTLTFERVVEAESGAIVGFLRGSEWPFHGRHQLSVAEAKAVTICDVDTDSFWVREDGAAVGLVRLFDLSDLDEGSPLFDLRIATEHRGRGLGTIAVKWLSDHLFVEYPVLHRIEATTRGDNVAMMTVLERCGYHREGVLREAWKSQNGERHDTIVYGLLRHEWSASA